MYLYTNILGSFVLDSYFTIVDSISFKTLAEYMSKEQTEAKLQKKYKRLDPVPEKKKQEVLALFKEKKYFKQLRQLNQELAKQQIKQSVSEDNLITQTISTIMELDKAANLLTKRLREWYGLYFPELEEQIAGNEHFVALVAEKTRQELQQKRKITKTMGADLEKKDTQEIVRLAKEIGGLITLRKQYEQYLKTIMQKYCPNFTELAGVTIGAKLLELAKGLKHLALLPASTIQLLGAEKALFRHIKTGARSPKFGVIHDHPIVQGAAKPERGRAARMLADKLSLCARLDFFKGDFKAKEYRRELEQKFDHGKNQTT